VRFTTRIVNDDAAAAVAMKFKFRGERRVPAPQQFFQPAAIKNQERT